MNRAMPLPGRVGLISGLFFGFAFGMGGIGAALLGQLADRTSIEYVYRVCSYLPAIGILTGLLPDAESIAAFPDGSMHGRKLQQLMILYGVPGSARLARNSAGGAGIPLTPNTKILRAGLRPARRPARASSSPVLVSTG